MKVLGLAVLTAGSLLLEIGLTRLFSFLYYPPYVFILISIAILGLGLGAAYGAWQPQARREELLPWYAAAAALAALAVTLVTLLWPQRAMQAVHLALAMVPFFWVGLAVTTLFSRRAQASPRLYLVDLLGAGLGAASALLLFDTLGLVAGLLATVALLAAAAVLWSEVKIPALLPGGAIFLVAAALLAFSRSGTPWPVLDVTKLPAEKPLTEQLAAGGVILETVWDSFARTDLVDPGGGLPYELYMDGAAGSVMPPAAAADVAPELWRDIGLFPFATEQPERVFIIGPGGGLDVWFGQVSRAQAIHAVEVNSAAVDLVERYAAYNGDLYGLPQVQVQVDEGRSVLARSQEQYDLIFLSHLVTLAAERNGLALVENSAFTVEAFASYLDHLTPHGQLALKLYDEPTLTRALATVLTVLNGRGLSDAQALDQVMAFLDTSTDPPIPLLMVRASPYSREDVLSLGAVADQVGFAPLFLPGVVEQPPLDAVAAGDRTFASIIQEAESDIRPVTDDRPFFYQFERGIPANLRLLLGVISLVILAGVALLVWALRGKTAWGRLRWSPFYFAGLGMGFMLAEIALIQQTRLYLGHPSLAISVVLAALLVAGGVGSWLGGRVTRDDALPAWPPLVVAGLLLIWLVLWPGLAAATLALPQGVRTAVVLGGLILPALAMGIPFALGLRKVGQTDDLLVAVAWAANGVLSVAGSVAAIALAGLWGYRVVLLLAVLLYLAVALSAGRIAAAPAPVPMDPSTH